MAKSNALTKRNGNGNGHSTEIVPLDQAPDFLPPVKHTGMESMGKDDFKTPRILLLQGLSPELEVFPTLAKKDNFWHNGMNIPLGKEFKFVPCVGTRRVILWRPREDQNGGILAMSRDGSTWDSGANQQFQVRIKGRKEPVIWNTNSNVKASRLLNFGTMNPDDPKSAPAASLIYEYLIYLPDHAELSPCVLTFAKTALNNGRQFNTALAMIARTGRPICSVLVKSFVEPQEKDGNKWTVPKMQLQGYIKDKSLFDITHKIAETYGDYEADYSEESVASVVQDQINY